MWHKVALVKQQNGPAIMVCVGIVAARVSARRKLKSPLKPEAKQPRFSGTSGGPPVGYGAYGNGCFQLECSASGRRSGGVRPGTCRAVWTALVEKAQERRASG